MTTLEAAQALHLSTRMIQRMCADGRIKAVRHGRDWWIDRSALSELHERPGPGRPPRKIKLGKMSETC